MSNPTRDKILATAAQLLEHQGYHATGLNQIVKESATPRGSLYYYFPDGKEELAAEAVRRRMEGMANHSRNFLSQWDDPIEAIHGLLLEMADHMAAQGCEAGAPIAAVALEASNTSERLRKACSTGYKGLEDVLAEKMETGGFPAEKAKSLAVIVQASIEGGMIMARTHQDANILRMVAVQVKKLLEMS